ncbi:MAG: Vms1/Ankzf1 family peptidyl-tRNA hydrolase [Acidimicrobiales bacterium]
MERIGGIPQAGVGPVELVRLTDRPGPFATVYLATEPEVENAAHRSLRAWKAVRAALAEAGCPDAVLERIEPLVPEAHTHGRCLAVVASEEGNLVVSHEHRPPPRDLGRWAPLPSLGPLLGGHQASPPHVVVLVDRVGADLVAVRRGRSDLHREAGGGTDPIRQVGAGGWSQRRYQQRAENTWEHNADDVAAELAALVRGVRARVVVVAGDPRARQLLREALPAAVLRILVEIEGGRGADGSATAVLDRVRDVVAGAVADDTAALVATFEQGRGPRDRAVEGPAATVAALARAQAETVLIDDDVDDERVAWFGPEPGEVALDPRTLVALGVGEPTEARLLDVVVHGALSTTPGVRTVSGDVGPTDGVGAILRWPDRGRARLSPA